MCKKIHTETTGTFNQKRLLKVDEVAEMLAVKPRTVRSWVYRNIIPSIKINGVLRFDRVAIEKFIDGGNNVD